MSKKKAAAPTEVTFRWRFERSSLFLKQMRDAAFERGSDEKLSAFERILWTRVAVDLDHVALYARIGEVNAKAAEPSIGSVTWRPEKKVAGRRAKARGRKR